MRNVDRGVVTVVVLIAVFLIAIVAVYFYSGDPLPPTDVDTDGDKVDPVTTMDFPTYVINLEKTPQRYEYVSKQLKAMRISHKRWLATDGRATFNADLLELGIKYKTHKQPERRGPAGCSASHIRLWKHLVDIEANWTLVLEDDVHFHPRFLDLFPTYWNQIPADAIIIFPGYCFPNGKSTTPVCRGSNMCTHSYIINARGAQYLLDNLLPMKWNIDIAIQEHFRLRTGSYYFNENMLVKSSTGEKILPIAYKHENNDKYMFNGIIYQNRKEFCSTIN